MTEILPNCYLLGTLLFKIYWSETLPGNLPMLEFNSVENKLFHVTTVAVLILEMYGCYVLFQKIIGLRDFQEIPKLEFNIF